MHIARMLQSTSHAVGVVILTDNERRRPSADDRGNADAESPARDGGRVPDSLSARQERAGLLRVLDASSNRASEGLRTLEDYARFVLDDGGLSAVAKELRHELARAIARLPRRELILARDTPGDCGTAITAESETRRETAAAVSRAAGVRTQQALRSIEEYGKCLDPEMARQVEAIRYRCYTLAASLESLAQRRSRLSEARLYLLVDAQASEEAFDKRIRELILAGADVIQLRDKHCSDRVLLQRAQQATSIARELSGAHRCLLIVNDRPDIAVAAGADGVHVGQDELPVEVVRRLVGSEMLVGVSTHDIDQAGQAVDGSADYIGCGPTFASVTKMFEQFPGLEFLREISGVVSLPAFAIGGISLQNLDEVLATGITRIAVAGAVTTADSPGEAVSELKRRLA